MNTHTNILDSIAEGAPYPHRDLSRVSTDDLVRLGEMVRDALFARVLDECADECEDARNGIAEDLAFMAKRTEWVRL